MDILFPYKTTVNFLTGEGDYDNPKPDNDLFNADVVLFSISNSVLNIRLQAVATGDLVVADYMFNATEITAYAKSFRDLINERQYAAGLPDIAEVVKIRVWYVTSTTTYTMDTSVNIHYTYYYKHDSVTAASKTAIIEGMQIINDAVASIQNLVS